MRNVSKQFKEVLKDKNRHMLHWADITLTNGTILNLDNRDLMQSGGMKIDDATSGSNSFDIGSVIINKSTITLDNSEDEYGTYDFDGASVVAYVGLKLPDGTTEKIRMGTYTVDEPKAVGSTIVLDCLDNVRLLDESYSKSTLQYPATLLQIALDACWNCGLSLNTTNFENSDYIVEKRPDDEATTFREVLSWVAQIACKFVRCDEYGRIFFGWYDEQEDLNGDALVIDGGVFDKDTPYSSGDNLDGGHFSPWDNETNYDAGTFELMSTYHHIWLLNSLTVGTDDIKITGVSVTFENESNGANTYLYGDMGYVLNIEKNDLIQTEDQAQNVAVIVGQKLVGMTFRTFSAGHLSDPTIEAGDTVFVTDRKQNSYKSYITNTVFTASGTQKSSCGAETPARKSSTRFTEATKALVEAKKNTAEQINSYDRSVQALTSLITQSFGVYKTEETMDDGSTIFYMHNKPELSESDTIWKMTADAFAVSTDGGNTWNAGMDSQGNAVVNVLSAIGIRFDWARGGTLTLGGENNVNGVLVILDKNGSVAGRFDNAGVDITGRFSTSWMTDIGDLFCSLSPDGLEFRNNSTVKGRLTIKRGISEGSRGVTIGTRGYVSIEDDEGGVVVYVYDRSDRKQKHTWWGSESHNGDFYMNGLQGKSARVVLPDNSYLDFTNGILTGGRTVSGVEL